MDAKVVGLLGAAALALGVAGPVSAGQLSPLEECLLEADKFENHPKGGPVGIQKQIAAGNFDRGLFRAEQNAEPGGDPHGETVTSDAGGGTGDECGDPGASGDTPASDND